MVDWLTPNTPPSSFDINYYQGGDWWIDTDAMMTGAESNYYRGYQMDSAGNVDSSVKLFAPFTDMQGELMTGYYVFDQMTLWYLSPPPATTGTTTTTM